MKVLTASPTVTINGIAAKKKMNGEKVYNFAAGDPVLINHPSIINKAIRQAEKGVFPYPPIEGIPELRRLAAEWLNASCKTEYSKENVLVTCGGKFALFSIVYTLLEPNEEVLIPAPYWVSYPEIVKMAGGTPRNVPTSPENGWKVTGDDLRRQITKNSKMLIFNNACNPTGVLYTEQEVRSILAVAKEFELIVVSDEVYSGLAYEDPGFISCGSFSEHRQRVLIVQSCSKNFGMTGWRVGFAFGPENIIKKLAALQSQSTTATAAICQWAAVGALENADAVNSYVKEAMRKRRDLFINTYNSLFPIPIEKIPSAIYAFVPLNSMKIYDITDSAAFCEQMITSNNIALVPGIAFGIEGYIRFAFSETEEQIVQGLHQLKQACNSFTEKKI